MSVLHATAQQRYIEGIIEGPGNTPVAYATIGIKESNRSVLSNEQGYFQISVQDVPQIIIISAIGYEMKEVHFTGWQKQTIILTPKIYSLKEVTVKSNEAYLLFLKAYKRLMKPGYSSYNGKAFYRLVSRNDDTYTELMEGFYDVQANPSGFNYWKLKHGRYAIVEDYKQQNYAVSIDLSALARLIDITNDHRSSVPFPLFPFSEEAKSGFLFEKAGLTYIQNKEISIVRFTAKVTNRDGFNGLLYIEESSGRLYRMEVEFEQKESGLITTQFGQQKVKNLHLNYTIDFTEHKSGKMLLSWININLEYNQPENVNPRRVKTEIQCMVYEKNALEKNAAKARYTRYVSDYAAIRSRLYIKPFWDQNPVIAQTALQQKITAAFESKGSFGTAYNQTGDTAALLKEGFALLGSRVNLLLSSLQENPVILQDSCLSVILNDRIVATLCSRLSVSFNCYNDSLHFYVLPLLDTTLTWVSDSVKANAAFSAVFGLYSRVAVMHSKQLAAAMMSVKHPCKKEEEIEALIAKANSELFLEQSELMQGIWAPGEFQFWERYLDKAEKE
jgi:hypothetical protein